MIGGGAAGLTMAESMERERLGMSDIVEAGDPQAVRPTRGFGVGYETLPEEITSDIDVTRLVHDLKRSGVEVRFPPPRFFLHIYLWFWDEDDNRLFFACPP